MCDNNVGVAKRLDIENISKEIADLVKELDEEIEIHVPDVKRITEKLERIIAEK